MKNKIILSSCILIILSSLCSCNIDDLTYYFERQDKPSDIITKNFINDFPLENKNQLNKSLGFYIITDRIEKESFTGENNDIETNYTEWDILFSTSYHKGMILTFNNKDTYIDQINSKCADILDYEITCILQDYFHSNDTDINGKIQYLKDDTTFNTLPKDISLSKIKTNEYDNVYLNSYIIINIKKGATIKDEKNILSLLKEKLDLDLNLNVIVNYQLGSNTNFYLNDENINNQITDNNNKILSYENIYKKSMANYNTHTLNY